MKKSLLVMLIAAILVPFFTSCSGDKEEPKHYPTKSEIKGEWGCITQGYKFLVTFSDTSYSLYRIDKYGDYLEMGTYSMGANGVITLKKRSGESKYSPLEVYWLGSDRTNLHIYPIGAFQRVK